jgi:hypothetical protein
MTFGDGFTLNRYSVSLALHLRPASGVERIEIRFIRRHQLGICGGSLFRYVTLVRQGQGKAAL